MLVHSMRKSAIAAIQFAKFFPSSLRQMSNTFARFVLNQIVQASSINICSPLENIPQSSMIFCSLETISGLSFLKSQSIRLGCSSRANEIILNRCRSPSQAFVQVFIRPRWRSGLGNFQTIVLNLGTFANPRSPNVIGYLIK